MSGESIKSPAASNDSVYPALNHINTITRLKFDGNFLKQTKVTCTHKKLFNIYIAYEMCG